HFFNPITFVLGCVFIVAIVNREWVEAVAVLLVIFVNSGIGATQEIQSEKAMEAIRQLGSVHLTTVVRDGRYARFLSLSISLFNSLLPCVRPSGVDCWKSRRKISCSEMSWRSVRGISSRPTFVSWKPSTWSWTRQS